MPQSTAQASRLFNQRIVKTHVCAQCFGVLVEYHEGGADVVRCPKRCAPGGFVTASHAEKVVSESASQFYEVAKNYPELAEQLQQTPAAKAEAKAALWG